MPDSFNDAPIPSSMHLPALPTGWQAIEHAILTDGTLAVLATDVDLRGEHQRIRAAFEKSAAPVPPSQLLTLSASGLARILIASPSGWVDGPTFPLETPFPLFDRFCDGRWLVVAARSRGEANARVISHAGLVLDRIMLGDGIEYVAVDTAHRIWVGWFDEGMFGNDNWRVPGQEWPPSSNGVGCFTTDGALLPIPKWPDGVGTIADCYALNVTGTGAWACPYTEFPLVCFFVEEPVRWWRGNLIGPKAIAIDGSHALVVGGFREDANRIALVALDGAGNGEEARLLASWALPLRRLPPSSQEWVPVWDNPTLLTGRGDTLHLVDNGNWFSWRVADFLAELEQ
jgi:hypothetical protein